MGVTDVVKGANPYLTAGSMLAPFLLAPFQHRKPVDWAGLGRYADSLRPSGYLTPEDLAAGEATKARLTRGAEATGKLQTFEAMRRIRARNLASAPAAEATLARVSQNTARARQAAGDTSEEQLYDIRKGNQRFEQQKDIALLGGRISDAVGQSRLADARQSTFFNSLLEYMPSVMAGLDKLHSTAGVTGRKVYNPATGSFQAGQNFTGGGRQGGATGFENT